MSESFFRYTSLAFLGLLSSPLSPLFCQSLGEPNPILLFDQLPPEKLPSQRVLAITRDAMGFMWFGTEDGLCRFDGHEYKSYQHNPADSATLSDNAIVSLLNIHDGFLWIGTKSGLNRLHPPTERIVRYDSGPLENLRITSMAGDSTALWIGSFDNGLYRMDPRTGNVISYTYNASDPGSLSDNAVRSLLLDEVGTLWVGTRDSGLNRLDRGGTSFEHFRNDPRDPSSLMPGTIQSLCRDAGGSIWISLARGLCTLNPATRRFKRHVDTPSSFKGGPWCVVADEKGTVWCGGNGLERYDSATDSFLRYLHQPDNPNSPGDNRIRTLFVDTSGCSNGGRSILWAGTLFGGATKIRIHENHFREWVHHPDDPRSLNPGMVLSLAEDDSGRVWVGLWGGGLNRIDLSTGHIDHFVHDPRDPHSLSNDDVTSLLHDSRGVLWVGTLNGLNIFNPSSKRFRRIMHNPDDSSSVGSNAISTLLEDSFGTLWAGTVDSSLSMLVDRTAMRFLHFRHDPHQPGTLSGRMVFALFETPDSALYVGAPGGLNMLDRKTMRFTLYKPGSDAERLGINDIHSIYADHAGMLWLGTATGLFRSNPGSHMFTRMDNPEWVKDWYIASIAPDTKGRLWLATLGGLFRVDPRQNVLTKIDRVFGYTLEGNCSQAITLRDGRILVGAEASVAVFHPDSLAGPQPVLRTLITGINTSRQSNTHSAAVFANGTIVLPYTDNFITLTFSCMSFLDPSRNKYVYKMHGIEAEWVNAGNRHFASYTNLDPGEYEFSVKGANADGVWSRESAVMRIIIEPPFWQRWWFRVLVIVIVAAAVAGIYNYRVSKLLEVERLRVRIATDLHDELGSNLSGIAMGTRMISRSRTLDDRERRQLESISAKADQTVDAMRDIVWFVRPEHDEPGEFLAKMKDVALSTLPHAAVTFHFPDESILDGAGVEERRNLFLAYKEIIANVARHAGAQNVSISISRKNGLLTLTVEDDGKGFDPSSIRSGDGLANLQFRVESMGGTMDITSAPDRGTTITINVRMA